MRCIDDLAGNTFGRLTALSHIRTHGRTLWLCKCECGSEKVVSAQDLKRAHTRSCGCLRNESTRERMTKHASDDARKRQRQLTAYRSNSTTRGREFSLSDAEFYSLLDGKCVYCGKEPASGIDRIDNEIGYTSGNSVSCCKTCNFMKHELSQTDFVNQIFRVYQHTIVGSEVFSG